jgi:hypothetical protein
MRIHRYHRPLRSVRLPTYLIAVIACVWMVGCTSPAAVSPAGNPKEQAAIEATAIIQRAQATALVLQAQAEATVLVRAANTAGVASTPSPASKVSVPPPLRTRPPAATSESASAAATTATPLASATGKPMDGDTPETTNAGAVELLGVEVGRESGLILVQFKAPPSLARRWQQGSVYVVDEATGSVYSEIPVAPVVGPLFGRPKVVGQTGYVMFSNAPVALQAGSGVTVVLGDFKQEHVTVR